MRTNILTKEQFVKVIDKLREQWDFQDEVGDVFYSYHCMAPEFPDSYDVVIDILNVMFGVETDRNWNGDIDYFCMELNFGRSYKPGSITENGNEIDFSSAEKLYDYLVEGMRNGKEE